MSFITAILVSFSRVLNVFLGGWSGEMLSARAYRLSKKSQFWLLAVCILDTIFFWEDRHCYNTFLFELENKDRPSEYH
jgi:heme O synthase-like polyprenyltransferase